MEKAVLKTLAYGDLFDYPMKAWEIHKWLIGQKASLKQVDRGLTKLNQKSKIKYQKGYYFLAERKGLVSKRLEREGQSGKYFFVAWWISRILKVIPWIKLVGVSGGLAVENAGKEDDLDFFIITQKNRLWLSRFFILILLSLLGKLRRRGDFAKKAAGKICVNILLDEDSLAQQNKDIYLAHEVLQMRVLWERGGVYSKFLSENEWVFKYLPNWLGSVLRGPAAAVSQVRPRSKPSLRSTPETSHSAPPHVTIIFNFLEDLLKAFQLKYMGKPKGEEKVSANALYFHPNDIREKILREFKKKVSLI